MIYKRKGEETVKMCENWTCQTVWKDSWLERHQDENVCPMCGTEFEEGEVKVLEPIKDRPKDLVYYVRMRLLKAEAELEETQCRLIQLEATPIKNASVLAHQGEREHHEDFAEIRGRHVSDLGKIAKLRIRCITLMNFIAETNGQIEGFKDIYTLRGKNL